MRYYAATLVLMISALLLPVKAQEATSDILPLESTLPHLDSSLSTAAAQSDSVRTSIDSISAPADSLASDFVPLPGLTSVNDSLPADSVKEKEDLGLTSPVAYEAADSLIFSSSGTAYLYREAHVTYGELELTGGSITMNMDSSIIYAEGLQDSTGTVTGNPVFKDASGEYESKNMRYNFVTQKGIIQHVVTQQGEGYVVSDHTKKMEDNSMYITGGKYTTCENKDHPHFYLALSKAKIRPGQNIVTGPAHLVLEDVHLPLIIPFGFFPFTNSYSSGIITPSYGDELSRGFYLKDGGYYFAINDYVDLALTGEIYSKGSWGVKARSAYRVRYKFSGSFNFSYIVTANSEKGLPDYSESKNMSIQWSHSQDAKSNPYQTFSASVNFATSGYSRNDLNTIYNPEAFAQNTKSSTINYTKRFPNFPLNISASASISQRSKDSTLTVTLPNLSLSVSRFYPLKRKNAVGKERFYEKISMSYSGSLSNSISEVKEYDFFNKSLVKDWRNGMKHSIPISATFNLFNYINITPSFNYTERWYTSRINESYDTEKYQTVKDTVWGFNRVWDYSLSVSASTKLYGFFQPWAKLFGPNPKVNMIRHVLTPSVSFSYRPDFGQERYGYYDTYTYVDANGNEQTKTYSHYQGSLYGTPSSGKSGTVSFQIANNLEMKVRNDKDTTEANPFKKISLIDNFSFGTSYNLAADSLNWSNISANLRLKFGDKYTLNLSGQFDPYTYELNSSGNPVKVNTTQWEKNRVIGKLISTGTSFSYTFNNDTFKKKEDKKGGKGAGAKAGAGAGAEEGMEGAPGDAPAADAAPEEKKKGWPEDAQYKPYKIPWSLSVNYTIRYARGSFNKETMEYDMKLSHNLSFNGSISLTDQWKVTCSTSYDFNTHKLATVNCSVTRDLHCWTMSASFIPVGDYKSYNFTIRVKSSMLQDLKYEQQHNPRDNVVWGIK